MRWLPERGEDVFAARVRLSYFSRVYVITIDSNIFLSLMLGVHQPEQFPPDDGAEVAFAGRSNAGKSSAMNAIVARQALARTSKTPGRTQQLNFFELKAG